ncbi:MAG: hypothetical protein LLF28_04775 [Nitrospiraceae bacterium]|nr:hypothetical protein [Nitrospiraceae bacterium]
MKKIALIVLVAAIVVFAGSAVYAFGPWGGGCGTCFTGGPNTTTPINIEAAKKFQQETASLREQMWLKRIEIQNEYTKPTPDLKRIADLQKEMIDIRTQIQTAAQKNGFPAMGRGMMGGMKGGRGMMGGGPFNKW